MFFRHKVRPILSARLAAEDIRYVPYCLLRQIQLPLQHKPGNEPAYDADDGHVDKSNEEHRVDSSDHFRSNAEPVSARRRRRRLRASQNTGHDPEHHERHRELADYVYDDICEDRAADAVFEEIGPYTHRRIKHQDVRETAYHQDDHYLRDPALYGRAQRDEIVYPVYYLVEDPRPAEQQEKAEEYQDHRAYGPYDSCKQFREYVLLTRDGQRHHEIPFVAEQVAVKP